MVVLVLRSGKEHRSHSEFLLTRNSVGQDTKNRIQQTQVLHSPFFARHDIIVCSCSDNIRAICCRMYVCVCVCLGMIYVNIYLILKFYMYLSVHAMKIWVIKRFVHIVSFMKSMWTAVSWNLSSSELKSSTKSTLIINIQHIKIIFNYLSQRTLGMYTIFIGKYAYHVFT